MLKTVTKNTDDDFETGNGSIAYALEKISHPGQIALNVLEGMAAANKAFWKAALPDTFDKNIEHEDNVNLEARTIQTYSELFSNHALAVNFAQNERVRGEHCKGVPYTGAFALYFAESAVVGYKKPLSNNENRTLYANLLERFNAYAEMNNGVELHNPPAPEELEKVRNWYLGRLKKNPSFTDTEIVEDHIQQILYVHPTRDPS